MRFILSCLLAGAALPAMAGEPGQMLIPLNTRGSGAGELRLTAESLRYDPAAKVLALGGKVKVLLGQLELGADRVTVKMADGGRPASLQASGEVRLKLGKSHGRAGQVRFEVTSGLLILTGDPHLTWAPLGLSLRGERISLDMESGMLSVDAARASIVPPESTNKKGEAEKSSPGGAARGGKS